MSSVNKCILIGHLGRDPEVRTMGSGGRVVNLSVATSEKWKDRTSGETKERTEWTPVVIFNEKLGEVAEKFLRKGSQVYVEGRLQTRKWKDQAGNDRYTTEVVLQQFRGELTVLSLPPSQEDRGNGFYEPPNRARDRGPDPEDSVPF